MQKYQYREARFIISLYSPHIIFIICFSEDDDSDIIWSNVVNLDWGDSYFGLHGFIDDSYWRCRKHLNLSSRRLHWRYSLLIFAHFYFCLLLFEISRCYRLSLLASLRNAAIFRLILLLPYYARQRYVYEHKFRRYHFILSTLSYIFSLVSLPLLPDISSFCSVYNIISLWWFKLTPRKRKWLQDFDFLLDFSYFSSFISAAELYICLFIGFTLLASTFIFATIRFRLYIFWFSDGIEIRFSLSPFSYIRTSFDSIKYYYLIISFSLSLKRAIIYFLIISYY